MNKPLPTESLAGHIDQNGVLPGPEKLAQFKEALTLRDAPALYIQEGKGDEAIVYVKIFDPCGSWSWFITEWDGEDQAFGLVSGACQELGYFSLTELASVQGALGIGLEIDVYFTPKTLGTVKEAGAVDPKQAKPNRPVVAAIGPLPPLVP